MNRFVVRLLGSPFHWLLSGRVQVVCYQGRRSGRPITFPTQYVELEHGAVGIVVGRAAAKRWWRNFTDSWPLQVCVRRVWSDMVGTAVWWSADPVAVDEIRQRFVSKYGQRSVGEHGDDLLVVVCRPVGDR